MRDLAQLIEETQSNLDTLTTKKIEREARISRLESLLDQYRADYELLNREHEALRMEVARSAASVSIVEAASSVRPGTDIAVPTSPENPTGAAHSASVTLMVITSSKTSETRRC
jgi:peptidoglycan hydrolase CwlO-like protein